MRLSRRAAGRRRRRRPRPRCHHRPDRTGGRLPPSRPPRAAASALAAAASTTSHTLGTKSLVTVLSADKNGFDRNSQGLRHPHRRGEGGARRQAALAPWASSRTARSRVTAFIPTDGAFRLLVRDLTGKNLRREADVFKAVASPRHPHGREGACSTTSCRAPRSPPARRCDANGALLTTAQAGAIKVRVVARRRSSCRTRTRTRATPGSSPLTSTRATGRSPTRSTGAAPARPAAGRPPTTAAHHHA